MPARAELFHRLAEGASAEARRRVAELGLGDVVDLRNVAFESHRAALAERDPGGGDATPALWDGEQLHRGRADVLEALARLAAPAPPG